MSKIIGKTSDLFSQINVVVRGSGVHIENPPKTSYFQLHPDCARELAALLWQAADVADMAVPGPLRNGKHDTKTSPPSEGHLQ
jgi:hypothetical protein